MTSYSIFDTQQAADVIRQSGKTPASVSPTFLVKKLGWLEEKAEDVLSELRGEAVEQVAGPVLKTSDEIIEDYRRVIGWKKPTYPKTAPDKKDGWRKSVIIGDPHAPYQAKDAIATMIKREAHDADALYINGDLTDLQNWSRHEKYTQRYTPLEEVTEAQSLVRLFSENFREVHILPGNHDARWIKFLVRKDIPPEILDAFRHICPNFDSPLHLLCNGFDNVQVTPAQCIDYAEFGWFHQVGDAVLTHAETYSKIPNKAVGNVIHWLKSYAEPQGLVDKFNVVIQNHTHQFGLTWNDYGVYGIENGCMCTVGDYCGNPKMMGAARPWMKAYTVLWQQHGVTDIDRLRVVPLGC